MAHRRSLCAEHRNRTARPKVLTLVQGTLTETSVSLSCLRELSISRPRFLIAFRSCFSILARFTRPVRLLALRAAVRTRRAPEMLRLAVSPGRLAPLPTTHARERAARPPGGDLVVRFYRLR
ncbi:hypothetical protein DPEC_G00199980 [Dallia pectoralis]|uniref:Uncharacterized protein n=1 Tax=Dallia pectoralis TaxID=75939 RepID=A0ACC2G8L1_DALPE|nr:hypothetical protein DPEC_G00199980 [Dallia pectoralis]